MCVLLISNIIVSDFNFNLQMKLFPHTLLGVVFVTIQRLEFVIDIEDCAYDSDLLSYVRFLVESCGSLQKLVIKVRISLISSHFSFCIIHALSCLTDA